MAQGAVHNNFDIVEIGFHFNRIINAIVAFGIEFRIRYPIGLAVVDQTDGFREAMRNESPRGNHDVDHAKIDHTAKERAHLGHRHGTGQGRDDHAIRVMRHGLQDFKCFAELTAAKGGLSHGRQKIAERLYTIWIKAL